MPFVMSLLIALVTFVSCQHIKYRADIGFLNSAQANSPEYLVLIGSKVCKDMDGIVGLCSKRVRSDRNIEFKMDKRPYGYRLNVTCSSNVNFTMSIDVLPEKSFEFSLPHENFSLVKSFTCLGEVFPMDRDQEVSAFWHARFVVYDGSYQAREKISQQGDYLVLGQSARHISVDGKMVSKKTAIKASGVKQVYTESEQMRINYYGY